MPRALLLGLVAVLWLVTGCKPVATDSTLQSQSGGGGAPCACNDLPCWRTATDVGAAKQLMCLKDVGFAAMDIAGGSYVKIVSALVQAGDAFADRHVRIALGLEAVPVDDEAPATSPTAAAPEEGDGGDAALAFEEDDESADAFALADDTTKKAATSAAKITSATGKALKEIVGGCMGGSVEYVGNLTSTFANALKTNLDDPKGLAALVGTIGSSVDGLGKLVETLGACNTDRLSGPGSEAAKASLKKFTDAMKAFGNVLKVGQALLKCSEGFVSGGKTLWYNTGCAVGDLQELSRSNAVVEQAYRTIRESSAPREDVRREVIDPRTGDGVLLQSCNGEPTKCSPYAMKKYGAWLYTENNFIRSRARNCAMHCTGSRDSMGPGSPAANNYCTRYKTDIFKNESSDCHATCLEPQCAAAVTTCVSFCCNQDGDCTKDAAAYLPGYGVQTGPAPQQAPRGQCKGGTLASTAQLQKGEALCSPSGSFQAFMQADGNFVVYDYTRPAGSQALWSSNTRGSGKLVWMQDDCNLVVYPDAQGGRSWASDTAGRRRDCYLSMQNDGNLVIYQASPQRALWSSQLGRERD